MSTHLSNEQLAAYHQRTMPPAELLLVSEHLGACDSCRARLMTPGEQAGGLRAVKTSLQSEPIHLSYEELETYVDGTMTAPDRVVLEAHARECRTCATDLEEIQAVRRESEPAPRATVAEPERAGFWQRLIGWRGGLVLAAAGACALLAVVLVRAPLPQNVPVAQNGANPANSRVIHDGTRILSVAGGRIEGLDPRAEPYRTTLEQALVSKRIEPAVSLQDLGGTSGVLLGAPDEPARGKLLQPLSKVVEDQRPTFRWEAIPGAMYSVSVYDDAFNMVAGSGRIVASEWQPTTPLRRGMRYSWQLVVSQNGKEFTVPVPPAPEARFRVLGESEEAEISHARSQAGGSHLVLGILYARAGLLDPARQELQALQTQNPDSAEVAGLLASVQQPGAATPK